MHMACEKNMIQTVMMFIGAKGGNPEIKNQQGFTCLHIAARNGYYDLVRILQTYSADIEHIRDEHGFTASYWAHQNGHSDIVQVLPPPAKRTKEEYYDFIKQVWEAHGFKPGGKKKKGKKGCKKKKW